MIEQIKRWQDENEEQYYGLDKETVNDILIKLAELDEENERLMQKLVEAHTLRGRTMIENDELRKALEEIKTMETASWSVSIRAIAALGRSKSQ